MDVLTYIATIRPDQVALGALVSLMVVSILRGWIVPRQVLTDRVADKQSQIDGLIVERDALRAAGEIKDKTVQVLLENQTKLVNSGDTTNRLIDTLRENSERIARSHQPSGDAQRQIEGSS